MNKFKTYKEYILNELYTTQKELSLANKKIEELEEQLKNDDTNEGKVFINNHEITDIDTFFKVAEENTRLLEQVKKQKEVIDMFLEKVDKNKKLLNNPELLDLYLKIKEV